jgi:hypothetical protein
MAMAFNGSIIMAIMVIIMAIENNININIMANKKNSSILMWQLNENEIIINQYQ